MIHSVPIPRLRHLSLALFLLLVMWKVVRMDWVVSGPYVFSDPGKVSVPSYSTYRIKAPVSPLWDPPEPQDIEAHAKSWDSLFPGGGAWGLTGPAKLAPDWWFIGFKIVATFVGLFPLLMVVFVFTRRTMRR